MIVGCYILDLYCDAKDAIENDGIGPDKVKHQYKEFPHEYTSELGSTCRRRARNDGWILHKDGTTTCPKCARRLRTKPAPKAKE